MKKYLLGVFAIVLAVGFSSFNARLVQSVNYQFSSSYTPANVELLSHWTLTSQECPSGSDRACRIANLPDSYVDGSGNLQNVTIETNNATPAIVTAVKDAFSGDPISGVQIVNKTDNP